MSYGQLVLLTNSFLVNSYFFSDQLVLSSTCTSTLLLVKYKHLFNVNTNFAGIFFSVFGTKAEIFYQLLYLLQINKSSIVQRPFDQYM